jgi:glycosyltransferase involved in cell wall biosynthesis
MARVNTMESVGNARRILILVENLPSPFDRRVWQEATTLHTQGYEVIIVCPTGMGYESKCESIDGIAILRYDLPNEAAGAIGYVIEYSAALFHSFRLAWNIHRTRGFDVVQACNPPDLLFVVGGFFKLFFGKKFVFDHHDICPELYEAKFGRRDLLYRLMVLFERWTFKTADISIATNESYRRIAIERGGMDPAKVYVVRSGPKLDRLRILPPRPELKKGKTFLVAYVGVMGKQEGIEYLLRAAAHIVKGMGRTDVHFGLVGAGTSLQEMKQLASELGIADVVTFTGRVPDQELLEMLNTADVCVNPDVANDMNDKSTMNKIMEYMALGKPIVQFDLTEGRVSAGEASLYAEKNNVEDLAEKILVLLDNPEMRDRMGQFGLTRVRNELEWAYEAPKLLRAYDAVFQDPVGRGGDRSPVGRAT